MECVSAGKPVDYGLPPRGTIRFLSVGHQSAGLNWFNCTICSHDRTLAEWRALIEEWRKPTPFSGLIYGPYESRSAAAEALEALLEKELKLRWIIRKFLARIRYRIYSRRSVGELEDLYTTLPIPAADMIKIMDYSSKSIYCFHTTTALKIIMSALTYNNYGIAAPVAPKNPYTNIPWNLGQLISLTTAIGLRLWAQHRKIPALLTSYRDCAYDLAKFLEINRRELNVEAALGFFRAHYSEDVRGVYEDSLIDLYDEAFGTREQQHRTIRRLAVQRLLEPEFMTRWDRLAFDGWMYMNHRFLHYSPSYDELLDDLRMLHVDSYNSWANRPRRILSRRQALSTMQTSVGAAAHLVTRSALEAASLAMLAEPITFVPVSLNHLLSQSLLDAINSVVYEEIQGPVLAPPAAPAAPAQQTMESEPGVAAAADSTDEL